MSELSESAAPWTAPRPDLALARVTGADAIDFLHGQFCNDLTALAAGQWQLSGYCSVKGRLLATLLVCRLEDCVYLVSSAAALPGLVQRLRMFVLRADVQIEALDWVGSSLVGDPAGLGLAPPTEPGHCAEIDKGLALNLGTAETPRLDLFLPAARRDALLGAAELAQAEPARAQALDIAAERPWLSAAGIDQFLPQMLNLDQNAGLSFRKGCYPGQEIVARTHYKGRLKQRMFRAGCAAAAEPGQRILAGDKPVGEVVSVAGSSLLVVLRLEAIDAALTLADSTSSAVQLLADATRSRD